MRRRSIIAAAALLSLAACSDTSTAPRALHPTARLTDMDPGPGGTCRSGYHVATRSDGTLTGEPD
jgi:hypothetical protein